MSQISFHIFSRIGNRAFCYFFRSSFGNDGSPLITTFRADINDIICGFDHIQVMFNNYNRMSTLR